MPDLTITTEQLTRLHPVLVALGPITPPPSAKGRYALRKLTERASAAFQTFAAVEAGITEKYAVPGTLKDVGNGRATFTVQPDQLAAYAEERKAILSEPVELTGCRALTLEEVAGCPLTVEMETVLVQCGLLPDQEPA